MVIRGSLKVVAAALLLDVLPRAFAHGDDAHDHGSIVTAMGTSMLSVVNSSVVYSTSMAQESYFSRPHLSGYMVAHIVLMTIAWLFILPLSKFVSRMKSTVGFDG